MNAVSSHSKVQVVIDHPDDLVSCGLRAIFGAQADMEVVDAAGAGTTNAAITVIVCDHDKAIPLATAWRQDDRLAGPGRMRVLVLTARSSEQEVREAVSAGVHGYLLSGAGVDEILRGVRTLAAGHRFLSPAVADRIADSLVYTPLTPREHQVLHRLGAGQCNKAIARQLGISVATVKAHVSAMMSKMNAGNRTQVVSRALQRGLLQGASLV